jgi:bacterioferritin-associated ferredoxin
LLLRSIRNTKRESTGGKGTDSMFVCICNAIPASALRDAALRCTGDAEAVYAFLGKTPQCRQCLTEADELIAAERALGAVAGELLAD